MSDRSTIDVEWVAGGRRGSWMVVQRMNAEDAREVAFALGDRDGARADLLSAADEVEEKMRVEQL